MASGFRRQSREPSLRSTSGFETTRTSEQASPNWPPRKEPNQTNSIMATRRRRRDNEPRHTGNRRGIRRRRRLRNTRFPAARYHLTGAGLSPAGPRRLRLTHRNWKFESTSLQRRVAQTIGSSAVIELRHG